MEERLELSAGAARRLWREVAACEGREKLECPQKMVRSQVQLECGGESGEKEAGKRRWPKHGAFAFQAKVFCMTW